MSRITSAQDGQSPEMCRCRAGDGRDPGVTKVLTFRHTS
jgi:hypothetical protein